MDARRKELIIRWQKAFGTTVKEAVGKVDELLQWQTSDRIEYAISEQERDNANAALLTAAGITEAFIWGKINTVHTIGNIAILEYVGDEGETLYHPYVDGQDTMSSVEDLDTAVLIGLSHKYLGYNSQFVSFAKRMLKMEQD